MKKKERVTNFPSGVYFRVDEETLLELDRRARERKMTRSEYIRQELYKILGCFTVS
ncbi:TPA: ribbon-helix-helix protein, CopG family [Stenotrophomonas maltophilia]